MPVLLDPTIPLARYHIDYAPRPRVLRRLKIGLVENAKRNSEEMLTIIADVLARRHEMQMVVLIHKPQRAPLTPAQISELKGHVDFAIIGVGDCGACSSGAVLDAILLEKEGIPAVSIITDAFNVTGKEMARLWNVPNFRFLSMQHPLVTLDRSQLREKADDLGDKVVELLQKGQPL